MYILPFLCFTTEELSILRKALAGWKGLRQDAPPPGRHPLQREWWSTARKVVNILTKQDAPKLTTLQARVLMELLTELGGDRTALELATRGVAACANIKGMT